MTLEQRIASREARVAIVGVGYVGLPSAVAFARAGFRVTAIDTDRERVRLLKSGESFIRDVPPAAVAEAVESGRLVATRDAASSHCADAVVICVPTPLDAARHPDLSHVDAVARVLHEFGRPGRLVVLESTVSPGTTRRMLAERLPSELVAFAPERVDPGNPREHVPRLVAGATEASRAAAISLYEAVGVPVVPVSSLEVAELAKLLENTFRAVNIALAAEVAEFGRRLGVDPFEVIWAAATKPFGFMPFYPGPGVGGHCIPVDPVYLASAGEEAGSPMPVVEQALSVLRGMPSLAVERVLAQLGRQPAGARILVYGVAYKPGVRDIRESPALEIIEQLESLGATVSYMDPLVPRIRVGDGELRSVDHASSFGPYDAVVICTAHRELDVERLTREATVVVDTCGALSSARRAHG